MGCCTNGGTGIRINRGPVADILIGGNPGGGPGGIRGLPGGGPKFRKKNIIFFKPC